MAKSETKVKAKSKVAGTWKATLVNGEVYALRNKSFKAGVPQVISDSLKKYLEANAKVNQVTNIGGKITTKKISRFEFVALAAPKEDETAGSGSEEGSENGGSEGNQE